ncbi:MAG: ABC transporter ATP-binding protein, partial [Chloroflexi bacterium]
MAEIRLEQVSVKYGDHYAVRDVTFTVEDKELCVLVGPSGSGKTTILRAIAGFLPL